MKLISLYILVIPLTVLVGCAIAMALPGQVASMLNSGPHGLSEVLYAFTSSAAKNGSAFGGFSGNTTWFDVALAFAMASGRFVLIVSVTLIMVGLEYLPALALGPLPTPWGEPVRTVSMRRQGLIGVRQEIAKNLVSGSGSGDRRACAQSAAGRGSLRQGVGDSLGRLSFGDFGNDAARLRGAQASSGAR